MAEGESAIFSDKTRMFIGYLEVINRKIPSLIPSLQSFSPKMLLGWGAGN